MKKLTYLVLELYCISCKSYLGYLAGHPFLEKLVTTFCVRIESVESIFKRNTGEEFQEKL